MDIELYLPIAGLAVNVMLIVTAGATVGFLSGLFGVGGGFLITPLLMFLGIPPDVAIASGSSQAVATSVASAQAHWKRGNVDLKMGLILLGGGIVGSLIGNLMMLRLRATGHFELVVGSCYLVLLSVVGTMMLIESLRTLVRQSRKPDLVSQRGGQHSWAHGLPFKTRFPQSRLYMSVIPPILLGIFIGLLSAVMGIGGGFVLIPALVYLLKMRTNLAVGTSTFQIVFVSSFTTIMLALTVHSVDMLLTMILVVGGVIATQFGTRASYSLKGEQLRLLLALLILAVGLRVGVDLVRTPAEPYSLRVERAL